MAAATLGTLLTTFAVVLNNHIVAAVSAADRALRVRADLVRRRAALAVFLRWPGSRPHSRRPNELPALSLLGGRSALLLTVACTARRRCSASCPAARSSSRRSSPRTGSPTKACGRPTCTAARPIRTTTGTQYTYTVNGRGADKLLARPPGHRPRRADASSTYALHVLVGHHGSILADAGVAAELSGHVAVARVAAIGSRRELAAMVGGL